MQEYIMLHPRLDTWLNYRDDLDTKWLQFEAEGVSILVHGSLARIAGESVIVSRDHITPGPVSHTYYTLPKGTL
jgi:hypothetical protein